MQDIAYNRYENIKQNEGTTFKSTINTITAQRAEVRVMLLLSALTAGHTLGKPCCNDVQVIHSKTAFHNLLDRRALLWMFEVIWYFLAVQQVVAELRLCMPCCKIHQGGHSNFFCRSPEHTTPIPLAAYQVGARRRDSMHLVLLLMYRYLI